MGKLIIDGNSVFEIDEECMKKRPPQDSCEVNKYFYKEELFFDKQNMEKPTNINRSK